MHCSHINEEMRQCIIYGESTGCMYTGLGSTTAYREQDTMPGRYHAYAADSDKSNARLIGIEYIISRRLFEGLPADEKKFWHSHEHEVWRLALPCLAFMQGHHG
jgi:Protein of unknown function (DUF1264)